MPPYTNPAFAALGIKSFSLPSRNWIIFWSTLATLSGGIIYDKWQQRQLRQSYMNQYASKNDNFPVNQKHRRLRIYISPPPNDYLDESMKYFRRFVKPILNSAGLDFQIITMDTQGDVRFKVAEEIRQIRRDLIKNDHLDQNDLNDHSNQSIPTHPVFSSYTPQDDPDHPIKSLKDLYKPMDVLGVEKLFGNFQQKADSVKSQDSLVDDVRNSGGIICIGRGAYKEYINGVNEGLLGPLDNPVVDNKSTDSTDTTDTTDSDDTEKSPPLPYITSSDYNNLTPAPELGLDKIDWSDPIQVSNALQNLRDKDTKTPYFFTQPILELRNFNVAGFTRQPERLWRFYHKRDQLIEYNENLINLINKNWCKFTSNSINSGIDEENDWPNSWKKSAIEKNSEWVRDFNSDYRINNLLSTYNCDCNNQSESNDSTDSK